MSDCLDATMQTNMVSNVNYNTYYSANNYMKQEVTILFKVSRTNKQLHRCMSQYSSKHYIVTNIKQLFK